MKFEGDRHPAFLVDDSGSVRRSSPFGGPASADELPKGRGTARRNGSWKRAAKVRSDAVHGRAALSHPVHLGFSLFGAPGNP